MYRDIFTNKWILGSLGFVILFASACYLYCQYEAAPLRQAERPERILQNEKQQNAAIANGIEQVVDAPVESITQATEKQMTEINSTKTESPISDNPKDVLVETQPIEKTDAVKVSPYGFGPYPEVPDGFLEGFVPSWEWSEEKKLKFGPEHLRNQEAIARVLIKLWNQGDREFYGAVGDDKVVRPLYSDAVYIEWGDVELPDGTTLQEISGYCAPEGFPILTMKQRMKGEIPAGYRVLDMQGDAIYVSEFLNDSNNDSN